MYWSNIRDIDGKRTKETAYCGRKNRQSFHSSHTHLQRAHQSGPSHLRHGLVSDSDSNLWPTYRPKNHMNHMNHDLPNHPCPPPSASTWIIVFTHTWPSASKPYQSQCKTFHEIFLSTPPSTGSLQEGSQWLHDSQEQRKASSIIVTQTMSIAFAKICGFNSCYSLSWKFDSFQVLILSKWIIKADVFLVAFVGFLFCCRN